MFDSERYARFLDKVHPEPNSGCWLWVGAQRRDGYGHMHISGVSVGAHRYSYEYVNGQLDRDLVVLHKCDNPSCVNPAHLRAGTRQENMVEMVAKKRAAFGDRNGHRKPKFTREQILDIRSSDLLERELAAKYSVHLMTISKIRRRISWKHV